MLAIADFLCQHAIGREILTENASVIVRAVIRLAVLADMKKPKRTEPLAEPLSEQLPVANVD